MANCAAEASQPLENESFVPRPSRRRLESPLDRPPATRMLSPSLAWGLLRPWLWAQEVPATARAHRRPGPVSLRRIAVMDLSAAASAGHQRSAAQWVLLAACQDPESRKQSANSPAFLQKCAQPGNLLVSVTFFLQRQTGDGCQVIALARRRRKTRMWLEGAIPDGSQHGLGLLAVTGPGSLLPPIHAGSRLV